MSLYLITASHPMHYTLRIVCSCLSPEAFKLKTHLYFHRVLICSIKFQGIITESAVLLSSVKLFYNFQCFWFLVSHQPGFRQQQGSVYSEKVPIIPLYTTCQDAQIWTVLKN